VHAKKMEFVGDFKNGGREIRPQGDPQSVHDFAIPKPGQAIPYGVNDLGHNRRRVSVGIDHDTAERAGHWKVSM
jgi:hypothetical protein